MESYESMLCGVVNSNTREIKPETYKQEFFNKIETFNFINNTDTGINFACPDLENMNFEGIEYMYTLLNGLAGTHYKVSSDYLGGDGKNTLIINEKNPLLKNVDKSKLPIFEFSNTKPINIFSEAEEFVSKHLREAVVDGTEVAKVKIQEYYNGDHGPNKQNKVGRT